MGEGRLYPLIENFNEEEAKKSETTLADTVTRLANKSKEADSVLKKSKVLESKNMNN